MAAADWQHAEKLTHVLGLRDQDRYQVATKEESMTYHRIVEIMKELYNIDLEERMIIEQLRKYPTFYKRVKAPGPDASRFT